MTPTRIIQHFNLIQNISPRKTSARTEKTQSGLYNRGKRGKNGNSSS